MCNAPGPVRLASTQGISPRKTSTLWLQSEATLIWGGNGRLPTETSVGNPNLRSDECGSRIPITHSRRSLGFIAPHGLASLAPSFIALCSLQEPKRTHLTLYVGGVQWSGARPEPPTSARLFCPYLPTDCGSGSYAYREWSSFPGGRIAVHTKFGYPARNSFQHGRRSL